MAILDFLGNDKKGKNDSSSNQYGPKEIKRDAGGKFVSKKKVEAEEKPQKTTKKKKTSKTTKPLGPFIVPFGGKEIRRYYQNKKWYFSIEDLLSLGQLDKPLKKLSQLKNDPEVSEVFKKNMVTISGVDCADGKGSEEILRVIIEKFKLGLPGSLLRWIEDISKLPFNIIEPSTDQPVNVSPGNPSDRG
jgi:hypothetical protein